MGNFNTTLAQRAISLGKAAICGLFFSLLPAVSEAQAPSPVNPLFSKLYSDAVMNSSYTSTSKIYPHLMNISDANPLLTTKTINNKKYVLTATWKNNVSFYPHADTITPYNTLNYDVWITAAPELKNKVKGIDSNHINMRLLQLLGLPPQAKYSYFVEMWVRPEDLYRPCPDNEITDCACGLCFPAKTDSSYIKWFSEQRLSRFFVCDTAARYPWTELGYTYDWNPQNQSHVGCSEYVIRQQSNVYINHIYTTNQYIYGK